MHVADDIWRVETISLPQKAHGPDRIVGLSCLNQLLSHPHDRVPAVLVQPQAVSRTREAGAGEKVQLSPL